MISNRAAFESLADRFEERIIKAKLKNNGMVVDKKTGALKPNTVHAKMLELKAVATEMISSAEYFSSEAKAAQAEAKSAITA